MQDSSQSNRDLISVRFSVILPVHCNIKCSIPFSIISSPCKFQWQTHQRFQVLYSKTIQFKALSWNNFLAKLSYGSVRKKKTSYASKINSSRPDNRIQDRESYLHTSICNFVSGNTAIRFISFLSN